MKNSIILVICWVIGVILTTWCIYTNNTNHQPWTEQQLNGYVQNVQNAKSKGLDVLESNDYLFEIEETAIDTKYNFYFENNPDICITISNDNKIFVEQKYIMNLSKGKVIFAGLLIGTFFGVVLWWGITEVIKPRK